MYTMQRISERVPCSEKVEFSVNVVELKELKKLRLTGMIIDKSNFGYGMITEYPLEPGHVIVFHHVENLNKVGVVRWIKSLDTGYRVGIQLR